MHHQMAASCYHSSPWSVRLAAFWLTSAVGDALGVAIDEVEVPGVDEEARGLAEDEHRVEPVDRVRQQRHATAHREQPEGAGHDALLRALRRDPLVEEARREERL